MNLLGVAAEALAAKYLQQQGLSLVARNYHCKAGEIDLIMRQGDVLVFVEVRLRSNSRFGDAGSSITLDKQRKLTKAAQHYLQQHSDTACRFDAILMDSAQASHIEWIRNAFDMA